MKRVALVTGGTRGIGSAICTALQDAGYTVAANYAGNDTAAEQFTTKTGIPNYKWSVSDYDQCVDGIKRVEADLGPIEILVNNAGAAWGVDYLEFPEAGWDKVMDLNVKTPFFLTQKLHTLLTAAASADKPGKVINITSIDGQRVNPWETYSYQASKAALIHLTRRMAARLVKDHVYVTSLAPGAFPSNMNRAARDHEDASAAGIPSKRVGDKFDMGGTAVYLASDAGACTTGEIIRVDGGFHVLGMPQAENL